MEEGFWIAPFLNVVDERLVQWLEPFPVNLGVDCWRLIQKDKSEIQQVKQNHQPALG